MINREPVQSCKIPFKSCQNSVIEHNLVTIQLSVEWPDKGGDDPSLVMHIVNKFPTTSCVEQNHSMSSMCTNTVNHSVPEQKQQETFPTPYQSQIYHHYQQRHLSGINFHSSTKSTATIPTTDFNDFLTTTTTELFNTLQPQVQNSTSPKTVQSTGNIPKSQLLPNFRYPTTATNQQFAFNQHVDHAPSSSHMNDPSMNMPMRTTSPMPAINPMPTLTTPVEVLKTASIPSPTSTLVPSSKKLIVCHCSNPPHCHDDNCQVRELHNPSANTILTTETIYRPFNDPMISHRTAFPSQVRSNDAIATFSITDPMKTSRILPVPSPDLMKTSGSSSNSTTIVSQQVPAKTINTSVLNANPNFQQNSSNFSPVMTNNSSNHQTTSSMPVFIEEQQNTISINPHKQQRRPSRHISLSNHDQLSCQNQNDVYQSLQAMNNFNSLTTQQNNNNHKVTSCPPLQQPERFIFPDHLHVTTYSTSDNTSNDSSANKNTTIQLEDELYTSKKSVRSPVELDIIMSDNFMKTEIGSPEINQTISDVIKGKGHITLYRKSKSSGLKPQTKKQPLLSQLVWEHNAPVTTTTYLQTSNEQGQELEQLTHDSNTSTLNVSNAHSRTPPLNPSLDSGQTTLHTLSPQEKSKNNNKKRDRSSSITIKNSRRVSITNINAPQSIATAASSSPLDISRGTTTSPITPQSNLVNTLISWQTNSSAPSSSSSSPNECLTAKTTTTTVASARNANQNLANDSWPSLNINHDTTPSDCIFPGDEQQHRNVALVKTHDLADIIEFLMRPNDNENFNASTPPPPSSSLITISTSITSEILTPTSIDRSANTLEQSVLNRDDIYENFFPSCLPDAEENQVIVAKQTLNNPEKNYSLADNRLNSKSQSQTPKSKVMDAKIELVKQTNNDQAPVTINKQQQQPIQKSLKKSNGQLKSTINKSIKHCSKISKQKDRLHPKPKQTSAKSTCTRCGHGKLVDITFHEFPKQQGLLFECVSCGNNSMRSNVSADERERRIAKVSADHLTKVTCQFCQQTFLSHNDYLMHLKNDHASDKPM
ncbi:unnamed protein product [Rotaria magnacalcarata]|uniref:C2H2-type domain-containing protein n=2 Tax=Rotaria magnacalcarata TaxID=392030 RepID=A0A816D7R7_9BILA|nr:unnamed protein product [Rotaria magnacalcarata]